jgi:hypothetical protein
MGVCSEGLASSIVTGCTLRLPPDGATMSPWVQATFEMSGVQVTVGNHSSPGGTAVIKDFELGQEKGLQCRITILDEQGSSFVGVMQDLLKDSKCLGSGAFSCVVNFGWVMDGCPSAVSIIKNPQPYYMICRTIDCNFSAGVFRFTIVATDAMTKMTEYRAETTYGTEQNKIPVTTAIRQMLTTGTPSISSVRFQQTNPDGTATALVFKETGDTKGRLGVWIPNSIDNISAAMDWLSDMVSSNGKGIIPVSNTTVAGGEIVFWEDYTVACGETKNYDGSNCIGTFYVNGGKLSNVLEFNPKISWKFAGLTSPGGAMGQQAVLANQNGGANPGRTGCDTLLRAALPSTGSNNTAPVHDNNFDANIANSATTAQVGHDAQQRAFRMLMSSITADLVIIGDPTMIDPFLIKQKNAKIIFLNPFYLSSTGGSCGDWLAAPVCNPVLSNKAWVAEEMTHRISEGKFTTTIRLILATPGVDIDIGQAVGGSGGGGWVPPANC